MSWLKDLLSDSGVISSRRAIGFFSFVLITIIVLRALLFAIPVSNEAIVLRGMDYLFFIILMGLFAVSATSIVHILMRKFSAKKDNYLPPTDQTKDEDEIMPS